MAAEAHCGVALFLSTALWEEISTADRIAAVL